MGKWITRPAHEGDAAQLAQVKSRYVRALYRGFLSADYLKQLDETYYLEQIKGWLSDEFQVDVLEKDGQLEGFIAYGSDPENASVGLIQEVGIMPSSSWEEKDILMRCCVEKLARQYELVRVWTVRDNFRARFLFENLGFRPDGEQRIQVVDGEEMRIIRHVCRTETALQAIENREV